MEAKLTHFLNLAAGLRRETPTDTNGVNVTVDFTQTATFVAAEHLSVVNLDGSFNLQASIARSIWIRSGSPAAAAVVTPSQILAARAAVGIHVMRHELLTILTHSSVAGQVRFRNADTVRGDIYPTDAAGAPFIASADVLWTALITDANFAAQYLPSTQLSALALVANAIHRSQVKGHNWLSDTTAKTASPGGRALAVAGGLVAEFEDYMSRVGHDLWHIFPDTTLYAVAGAMTGYEPATLMVGIEYGGVDIARGTLVSEVFKLDDAAKDRYPPSELGKAAAILGSRVMKCALTEINVKCEGNVEEHQECMASLDAYSNLVSAGDFTRANAQTVKQVMGTSFAFCYGVVMADAKYEELYSKNKSLKAWADQNAGDSIIGNVVGKWCKSRDARDEKINSMLAAFFASITTALERLPDAVAANMGPGGGGGAPPGGGGSLSSGSLPASPKSPGGSRPPSPPSTSPGLPSPKPSPAPGSVSPLPFSGGSLPGTPKGKTVFPVPPLVVVPSIPPASTVTPAAVVATPPARGPRAKSAPPATPAVTVGPAPGAGT